MKSSKKWKIGWAGYSILSLLLIIILKRHAPACAQALCVNGAVLQKKFISVYTIIGLCVTDS